MYCFGQAATLRGSMTSDTPNADQAPQDAAVTSGSADDAPSVSVVIPVGRADEDLRHQLAALAAQDYSGPWQLVISLNTDSRQERTQLDDLLAEHSFDEVHVVDSSDVRSAAHARNTGALAAGGDYLIFCDGDDIADERWLSVMVGALDEHDVVGGHLDESLLEIDGQQDWRPPATPGSLPTFLGQPFLVSANMGLHRRHFEESGGFDTSLIRCEDVDFSWNLIEKGLELTYIPDAIIHYRHRRGLRPMMQQHYLYGRGFSQLLARRSVPGEEKRTGLSSLKPNNQAVKKKTPVYYCRRGSIAAGRVVGLIEQRLGQRAKRG